MESRKMKENKSNLSKPAQSLYNKLVAHKICDPSFSFIEVQQYYEEHFVVKPRMGYLPVFVRTIPQDLIDSMALVSENDFCLLIDRILEAHKSKNEVEEFTKQFNEMLAKFNIDTGSNLYKETVTNTEKAFEYLADTFGKTS